MANPYGVLFRTPGSRAFTAAGFVARMPLAMAGIGIIAMVSQMRGDYGLAGAVSATFTLSMALCGPRISRAVDRRGQSRVLPPVAGLSVMALGALLLCARYDAPAWTLFGCAAVAGAMPNMAAMVRARWTHALKGSDRLHTAYSLESVVDELTFVVGPALSVALCTALFPEAGPLVAGVLLVLGVLMFVPQKRTEPPVARPTDGHPPTGSAIRSGALRLLALTLVAGGAIVGTVDVVSVSFAEQQGSPAGAGIVLSVYAAGSAVAGLVFGALRLRTPLPRLLVLGTAGTALTTLPLLLVGDLVTLSAAVFLPGLFFAPTMIVVMGLVERTVPPAVLTEGMTWAITGLSVGVASGAAVSGAIVDRFGPGGGFVVAVAAGATALLTALCARRPLERSLRERADRDAEGPAEEPAEEPAEAPGGAAH
ncbi:MFS transporter [Streptomyces anulatus]|uniref:MFS transporter n=1 Tax=Streptomyces anulatus TaxID=1892 RepID=UPI002251D0A4|nr:MFS transporter [Streptomyces anulatus]MCX4516241.1 MFS transporter [Streptomyces anulatus]MCX4599068.1 MFS transporter [Streptomyces anulatus]